ncbi:DUF1549 and DUF1553 domain-containing protein [Lignipirellula cremea]|uniref:Cytochrome c domain-containing protein n=1 Tax=Lignipirellula cremea TaxID=2528010 RepID=A0A518DXN9_9BACT|nr:DUF1549 and DUF1553 domain-containing protein [Lignipirellula cremea]QDU96594.1 hypothetical protein Pla8534_44150 [Lignipirellula cremea]
MCNHEESRQPNAPARDPRFASPAIGALVPLLALRASVLCIVFLLPTLTRGQDGALRDTIDREVKAAWAKDNLAAPERSTDSVFLRRIYLDLVGMIPTYEEATAFLGDADPQKREKLIDKLLADPRYARNQAQVWDVNLLGRNPQGIRSTNRDAFRNWLATHFEQNVPYDRIVHKLLKAEEDNSKLFYVAYRNSDDLTTTAMRFFLGTQLQCAKCHDHPYESWTQQDYYGMAGFFVRTYVVETDGANEHIKKFYVGEKSTGDVSFTVLPKDAQPGTKGEPVKPRFLGGEELQEPELPADFKEPKVEPKQAPPKPLFSRREKIVEWITAKDNPYLARAAVNRIWAQFMGRGFVHPVDDFNSENDPSHPELLKAIEAGFIAHQFDLKWLIREIVNSAAYQAADVGPVTDALPKYYERARIRPLSVEELTASLHIATGLGVEAALKSKPSGDMLKYLGDPTDGQGRFQGSLTEHLFIHNGDTFRGLCYPRNGNLAETLLKSEEDWNAKVERMFLSVLSRTPTTEERERFVNYLNVDPKDTKLESQRMEEALWVLVATSEFRFSR